MPDFAIEIRRGNLLESRAMADVAVVDSVGQIIAWFGDPYRTTFWRSSSKPFQAMPLIQANGADVFGLSPKEIAMLCASHGGEPIHLELVRTMLEKVGALPEDLICGIHTPSDKRSAEDLLVKGDAPSVLHNNCSGKHTGMLMLAKLLKVPFHGYEQREHPVQQHILDAVAMMTGIGRKDSIPTAIDGCSAPNFYLSLTQMAYAYARLVDPRGLEPSYQGASLIISEAMRQYPEVVSGTGRLEVTLGRALDYRVVSKGGAEAVFCIGIPEKGWGIAVKVDDGMARTIPPMVIAVLDQLGILDNKERRELEEIGHPLIRNHAGIVVGEMAPVLSLQRTHI